MKTARDAMKEYRESARLTKKQAAEVCGVSEDVYKIVENGGVTHPNLAAKIGEAMGLSELQTEELMPENHRPHSDKYEPDKYVERIGEFHPKRGEVTWIQKEDE